jgi:amino acid adenylation domain-containing protein/thioester reductase-like protein
MEQFFGESVANITGEVMFNTPVDIFALRAALNKIAEQCDSLRIRINTKNNAPMQYIKEYTPFEVEAVSFATRDEYLKWIEPIARTPFDMNDDLFKFYIVIIGQKTGFAFHQHHLTSDGWSQGFILNSIIKILCGEETRSNSYIEYISAEREYENSARFQKDKAFFMSCFEKCSEPVYLSDKQAKSVISDRLNIKINADDSNRIQAFCKSSGVSPFSLLINALATYIYRIKGAGNLFIGTTVLNRAGVREKETAGMFVNTIPVLFNIDENMTMLENMQGNSSNIMGVFRHQKYQYIDLLKDIREQYNFTDRLYDVSLNYQIAALSDKTAKAEWQFCGSQGESLNIHISDMQGAGAFHLNYDYQTELFTERDIERIHEHLLNIIFDIIENPDKKPQDLKLLSDKEYNRIVHEFNDTAIDFPKDKCIHQLFEEQAAKTPEAVAVIFEDVEYTYRQINEMANALAHDLRSRGVGRNGIVAIIAKRSYKIIVAQLAILKAGGAYMPIDPNYPIERINYMLNDVKCKLAFSFGYDINSIETIKLDNDIVIEQCNNLFNVNNSDDNCLVIFTSGTTGEPKGTIVHHKGLSNYTFANNALYEGGNCVISFSIFTFDAFTLETILPLIRGKKVVLSNEDEQFSQTGFENLINNNSQCNIFITPAKLKNFIVNSKDYLFLKNVNKFCIGGEVFPQDLLLLFPSKIKIFNVYGPTECSMWTSEYSIQNKHENDIPIGKPLANTQIYIVDKCMNVLPIGAAGELCIAGAGVGKGYLNRPELTAEKFIDNPFGEGKMYKTGDLAKWREDGNIDYIGRIDNQVKIRGLRIELGEIEAAISQCEGVKQNAVVVKTDDSGRQYICAYYIGSDLNIAETKAVLAKKLPQYMIPHFFIEMEQFPTTPSGKTDRKAFPVPDFANIQADTEYVAPVTETEKLITAILEKVLNVQKIGVNDNFFDLGGDSLKAIEFVSTAQSEGVHIALQSVFDTPTVALMAKHITGESRKKINYLADDFIDFEDLLKRNKITENITPEKQSLGDVLITGATGWLGSHILDEFLSNEKGLAYCLIRGTDLQTSQKKLNNALEYYFGDKYANCDRIVVICGDITTDIALNKPINTIIHSAANVKHYGTYEQFYKINVIGTKNIIALAKEKNAKLIHISTLSVSGNSFEQPDLPVTDFDESKFFIGQSLDTVYVRSKFEAEIEVLQAKLTGLKTAIVRVGNLTNRHSDSKFQRNYNENGTLTRLKAIVDLGLFPKDFEDFKLEFSPVCNTAKAIITLSQHFDDNHSVYHAYNHKAVRFDDFIKAFKAVGTNIESVSSKEFKQAVNETVKLADKSHIHRAFIDDYDSDGKINFKSNIEINNNFTTKYLNQAGFEWRKIDSEYLTKYIEYFNKIGYWRATQ